LGSAEKLGQRRRRVEIDPNDDSAGHSEIGDCSHLPIEDQIAICIAGLEAQYLFGCPFSHPLAGASDFSKIIELVEDGRSEEDSKSIRDAGAERARNILIEHRDVAARLAQALFERGRIDAGVFLRELRRS